MCFPRPFRIGVPNLVIRILKDRPYIERES
jgi:hypothetical protein